MPWLVTGGTGFVGSHFVNEAHRRGHELRVLRRRPDSRPRVPYERQPARIDRPMDTLTSDDFAGIDAVVHLAAHSANVPYDTIEACLHHNVTVPLAMFRAAAAAGVTRWVVAGSCFEYGPAGERYEFIPTDAPLEATASYPLSKAVASRVLSALAVELDARLSIHRIFQVYGPGEAATRLWPSLVRAAETNAAMDLTPGDQVRDFVDVRDVASQLVDAAERDAAAGRPVVTHVGSGRPRAMRDFATDVYREHGGTGSLNFGARPHRVGEVMRFVPAIETRREDSVRAA